MDWNALLTPLVVAVVPLIIAVGKKGLGSATWLIPPIAVVLGGVGEGLTAYLQNRPPSPVLVSVLGLAGVGLRELVVQLSKPSEG